MCNNWYLLCPIGRVDIPTLGRETFLIFSFTFQSFGPSSEGCRVAWLKLELRDVLILILSKPPLRRFPLNGGQTTGARPRMTELLKCRKRRETRR